MTTSLKEKFEKKFVVTPGCWNWIAYTDKDGYGVIVDGVTRRAHRVSYTLYVGDIQSEMVVRHRCDNRRCVNPDHLVLGSHADNVRDRQVRQRTSRGSDRPNTSLSEQQAALIFSDARKTSVIASEYGVSNNCVLRIKRRETWKHVSF